MFTIPTSNEIITKSIQTLKRFPLVLLSSIILSFILIYFIEVEVNKFTGINLILVKLALSASLSIFIFTGVTLFAETLSPRLHLFVILGAFVAIITYYMILPQTAEEFNATTVPFKHFFVTFLFFIALLWAPFTRESLNNEDYWEYAKGVLFAFSMSISFTFILIFGVNVALYAVETLFDLDIDTKHYFELDLLLVAIFSVAYFLSQIPLKPLKSKASTNPPKIEKFYTKWILTPLSILYFLILYAYTFKILTTLELPKGILAWLIVAFSIVLIITYLFWTHFVKTKESRWRRWIWLALFFQTLMLFGAISIRISEYSWTESRYMVFLLGVWLAGISLYFLFYKRAQIKWIFISLSIFIALSQFGLLSAYSISKNAQIERLQGMLISLKSYKETSQAPLKLRYEISDSLRYLHQRYRGEPLKVIFPKISQEYELSKSKKSLGNSYYFPNFITKKLGFRAINRWDYRNYKEGKKETFTFYTNHDPYSNTQGYREMLNIKDYDYMAQIHFHNQKIYFNDVNVTLSSSNSNQLCISQSDKNITIDIGSFMQHLIENFSQHSDGIEPQELTIKKENKNFKIKLQLNTIREEYFDGNRTIEFDGAFFIKL